jgi:hypothetical protein
MPRPPVKPGRSSPDSTGNRQAAGRDAPGRSRTPRRGDRFCRLRQLCRLFLISGLRCADSTQGDPNGLRVWRCERRARRPSVPGTKGGYDAVSQAVCLSAVSLRTRSLIGHPGVLRLEVLPGPVPAVLSGRIGVLRLPAPAPGALSGAVGLRRPLPAVPLGPRAARVCAGRRRVRDDGDFTQRTGPTSPDRAAGEKQRGRPHSWATA